MKSYKFLTNVCYNGTSYPCGSVHFFDEQDALNLMGEVEQVSVELPLSIEDFEDVTPKVAPKHPNKMVKAKRTTKKSDL